MSLKFGWRATEVRESIWKGDLCLLGPDGTSRATAAALAAWQEDGDASHLRPFCEGTPTIIRVRTLSPDELQAVQALLFNPGIPMEGYSRAILLAFRIGIDFAGKEEHRTPEGAIHGITVNERGIRMLAEPIVAQLAQDYPGMVWFYGKLILDASQATEKEKKASSPPSTPTPSSAAESTAATTGPSPGVAGA